MKNTPPSRPTLTGSDLTPAYLRALLAGKAESHVDSLQNAALCNTIRNNGALVARMGGNFYDVTPCKENAQHFRLLPLTVTLNGIPGQSTKGLDCRATVLHWGWVAFQDGVLSGKIDLGPTI